jgi:hypothetical protein
VWGGECASLLFGWSFDFFFDFAALAQNDVLLPADASADERPRMTGWGGDVICRFVLGPKSGRLQGRDLGKQVAVKEVIFLQAQGLGYDMDLTV